MDCVEIALEVEHPPLNLFLHRLLLEERET